MPHSKAVKPLDVPTNDESAATSAGPFVVPMAASGRLWRRHAPVLIAYLSRRESRFNLLDYFHHAGQHLVGALLAGCTNRELYTLVTTEQEVPLPVGYRQFCRTLATFREEKGLRPSRVCPSRTQTAPSTLPAPLASVRPTPGPEAVPSSDVPALRLVTAPVASSTLDVSSESISSTTTPTSLTAEPSAAESLGADRYANMWDSLFPAFTQEDLKTGKPIAEVAAEQQRAELAAFEQSLRDGHGNP